MRGVVSSKRRFWVHLKVRDVKGGGPSVKRACFPLGFMPAVCWLQWVLEVRNWKRSFVSAILKQ
jgi:hypothetical protein